MDYVVSVTATDLGLTARPQIDIGGTPIRSTFFADEIAGGVAGVPMPANTGKESFVLDAGIFVPNQAFFTLQVGLNERLDCAMLYRELPSVEEVG